MMNVLENTVEIEAVPSLKELEPELDYKFKRAQDTQCSAFHVQGKGGTALCGTTDIYYGTKTVTVEGIMTSLPHQNGGWWWCDKCLAAFTGKPEQEFTDARLHRRY